MENTTKLLERLKKLRETKDISLNDLLRELVDIKKILVTHLLQTQLKEVNELTQSIDLKTEKPGINFKDAVEQLSGITTVRMNGQKREFLLHRPTENFEYEKSDDSIGWFEAKKEGIWYAEYTPTEGRQIGANPVVSCWVMEENIVRIPTAHDNTGTWGDLGKNPFADKYAAVVKPGKYEIYQQLKKSDNVKNKASIISLIQKIKNKHPDVDFEDEDPWTEAKYRRGGEKEWNDFIKNPPIEDDELHKAVPKIKKPISEPKAPKIKAVSQNRALAEKVAGQAKNEIVDWGESNPQISRDKDGVPLLTSHVDNKPTFNNLYRAYKNTPHKPESLLLKYAVHRMENADKYEKATPDQKNELNRKFLSLHQKGKAAEKNGNVRIADLNRELYKIPHIMEELLDHRDTLHKVVLKHFGNTHVHYIDGEPHVGLTRGLNVDRAGRGEDHALASYAHAKNTGFGSVMHHQLVPLKNIWYSFDFGPKSATSEKHGNEREWLVSPHDIKYTDESKINNFLEDVNPNKSELKNILSSSDLYDASTKIKSGTHVRRYLASNPNLDPKLHHVLANDKDNYVRRDLASNPNLDPKLHHVLANDKDNYVRRYLASNPNLDPKLHHVLANDKDNYVRRDLASNPNLDPKLHHVLANDKDNDVRRYLASNPNLDPKLKQKILGKS